MGKLHSAAAIMTVETGVVDGLIPVLMAKAATESCRADGKFVKIEKT